MRDFFASRMYHFSDVVLVESLNSNPPHYLSFEQRSNVECTAFKKSFHSETDDGLHAPSVLAIRITH